MTESGRIKRQAAETIIEDLAKAVADTVRQSFPNFPIRVLLQKGSAADARLGILIMWDEELEKPELVTYPTIHKATASGLRMTDAGRQYLRQTQR